MAFFVGRRESGRTTYFNLNRAQSIVHDQTSVDRARWVFEFGLLTRTTIIVQEDSQADAYNRISAYFADHSTGV